MKGDDGTPEVYRRLGLRRCINACGHVTALGGSLMPEEVTAAMAAAARSFVPLAELHAAAGRRIAELTGAGSALVTTGAAGAIVLAAAACIAGGDEARIRRLLDSAGLPNRILVPPTPGLTWVHYTRLAGGRVAECEEAEALSRLAAEDDVAMLLYLPSVHGEGPIALADLIEVARATGKPLMVDAADKLPPPDSLRGYLEQGVDLVGFSGGKGLRGPQCTGLLMGRRHLVDAAYRNACAPGIGRPMKVGKEEIAGVVAALELYLACDHEAEADRWYSQLDYIQRALGTDLGHERYEETRVAEGARLRVHTPEGLAASEARRALSDGTPRVMVGAWDNDIVIDPQTLQPGEEVDVARALRHVLLGENQI